MCTRMVLLRLVYSKEGFFFFWGHPLFEFFPVYVSENLCWISSFTCTSVQRKGKLPKFIFLTALLPGTVMRHYLTWKFSELFWVCSLLIWLRMGLFSSILNALSFPCHFLLIYDYSLCGIITFRGVIKLHSCVLCIIKSGITSITRSRRPFYFLGLGL